MQFNYETDHALRVLLYLANKGDQASASEIGDATSLSRNHAQKILRNLHLANLVSVTYGSAGGFRIARPASEITFLEILNAMEKTTKISRCLEEKGYCYNHDEEQCVILRCPMRKFFIQAQNQFEAIFGGTTLQDFLDDKFDDPNYMFSLVDKIRPQ